MTKRETVKIIRDIMTGRHGHDSVVVKKQGRGYDVYTTINFQSVNLEPGDMLFRHDRNKITIEEAARELDRAEEAEAYEATILRRK